MNIKCLFGLHENTRLKGMDKFPILTVTGDSLKIEIEYCSKCGLLHGNHLPKKGINIKKIISLFV